METTTNFQQIAKDILNASVIAILNMFKNINGANFVGIRGYTNKQGEISNNVIIADFNYGNAVKSDIEILNSLSENEFSEIAEKYNVCNFSGEQYSENQQGKEYLLSGKLPKEGTKARENVLASIKTTKTLAEIRNQMVNGHLLNSDKETRSSQSEAQIDAYEKVTNSIKICKATGNIHIYALAHSKQILTEGTYPESKPTIETQQKNAIQSYCKSIGKQLPTTKYRNYIVTAEQMTEVAIKGEVIEVE